MLKILDGIQYTIHIGSTLTFSICFSTLPTQYTTFISLYCVRLYYSVQYMYIIEVYIPDPPLPRKSGLFGLAYDYIGIGFGL